MRKFNFKQTAGNGFMVGLSIAAFVWFLFGWALSAFQYAKVFKSINHYGFAAWLSSDLPFMAPLILFWFIILFILALLWLVCLTAKTIKIFRTFAARPVKNSIMAALYIITVLLLIGHAVDLFTTTRTANVPIANEGVVTFKDGLEITVAEINYTNGEQYINTPVAAENKPILRNALDLQNNTALIGIKPPNQGVVYGKAFITKPFQHAYVNVIIENFYSDDKDALEAAGVMVTVSRKPLMPVLIVLYLLLALSILGVIIAPKLERTAKPKAEPAPKLPGATGMAKTKKKNKRR